MPNTNFSALTSKIRNLTADPAEPVVGDFYYDTTNNRLAVYNGSAWVTASFTTTTSTSTSTTSTSTSTTSTSSSTSSSTTTSTSSSTSTTTTL